MREVEVRCDDCGTWLPLDQMKEIVVMEGTENAGRLMDACPTCLDTRLQQADTVEDTPGFRQRVAALLRVKRGSDARSA